VDGVEAMCWSSLACRELGELDHSDGKPPSFVKTKHPEPGEGLQIHLLFSELNGHKNKMK